MSLRVVELFAGVGGFRLGLEKNKQYKVVWSNQWEPMTKAQHASMIYENKFGNIGHSNKDIESVPTKDIPNHDVLCAGFPCQDYSVASTLKNSKGLIGKKGVLWWSIYRILSEKKVKPSYLILENVDRLLNSPSTQRGRDFGVILKSLDELGYAVEWRVINAGDYGMPQRRRRIFFLGYKKNTNIYKKLNKHLKEDWISKNGVIAKGFPVDKVKEVKEIDFSDDLLSISKNFNKNSKKTIFENTGVMINGNIYTAKTVPNYKGKRQTLGEMLEEESNIPEQFYINKNDLKSWKYLKGGKKEQRETKDGFKFTYSEGPVAFPDPLNKPSRTIITSEGGASPSRFRHAVKVGNKLRRLTPLELERLNMFPDNFTKHHEVSDSKRAFMMGNALVVGVVEKLGKSLYRQLWVYKNENYKQTCSTCEIVFNSYHFYDDGTPKYDHKNEDSVLKYAKKLEGKTLREVSGDYIRNAGVKGNAKGKFGSNIEKFYFGYVGNSSHEPDFTEIGVEIKSTGLKTVKDEYAAKERISLAIVDFQNIENQSFEDSVWEKMKKPLMILYDYKSKEIRNFDKKIVKVDYYEYSDFEKEILYLEWKNIKDTVVNFGGQEVSQSKLKHKYLEACTTGKNSKDRVKNRKGLPDCKPRRFAFHVSYANKIVKKMIYDRSIADNDTRKEYVIKAEDKPNTDKLNNIRQILENIRNQN